MEDHHHHQQHHSLHNYGVITPMSDFGSGLNNQCNFPSSLQQLQPEMMYAVPVHRNNPNSGAHQFDMLMMAQHQQYLQQQLQESDAYQQQQQQLHNDHEMMMLSNNNGTSSTSGGGGFGADNMEANVYDGVGGGGRWPRQETLTLLEIRSRLDQKFKEANQKGPLWDEISRIMSEEHGYNQRSGRKCREKFENLYKYYKKTKEGKAGRQDGKHYRFFRQLEALYGETKTNPPMPLSLQETSHFLGRNSFDHFKSNTPACGANPINSAHLGNDDAHNLSKRNNSDSLSLSCNSSDFETSSDGYNNFETCENGGTSENKGKKRSSGRRNWRAKVKDFIDSQMRKLVEKQEAWLAKIVKTIEQKEQERLLREEEWRKREEDRMDKERKFWANERQWIEARDANLMEALRRFNGGEQVMESFNNNHVIPNANHTDNHHNNNQWAESEITKLIQLRTCMGSKFGQVSMESNLDQEYVLWEEIAARMASEGSNKTSLMCKNKWESIDNYVISPNKQRDSNHKKQKGDNSRSPSSCFRPEDINQIDCVPLFSRIGSNQTATHNNFDSLPFNLHEANNNSNMLQDSFFRFLMVDGGTENNQWSNNNN